MITKEITKTITKDITKSNTKLEECREILEDALSLYTRSIEDDDNLKQDREAFERSEGIVFRIQSHIENIDKLIFQLLVVNDAIEYLISTK